MMHNLPAAHHDHGAQPPSGSRPPHQSRRHCDASALTALRASDRSAACCGGHRFDDVRHVPSRPPPSSRVAQASGARGAHTACFQTGAHAPGGCPHCCRRLPRDHARKRAQGATVFTAFDHPMPLSVQYANGGSATSDFPVSAITDRFYARTQFMGIYRLTELLKTRLYLSGLCGRGHRHLPLRRPLRAGRWATSRWCSASIYCTGTTGGAPFSFTKKTRNFAGWESLAFFETLWMSSGDS
jgi:hypothetical protein